MRSLIDIVAMPSVASSDIDKWASGCERGTRGEPGRHSQRTLLCTVSLCIAGWPELTGRVCTSNSHQHGALQMLVPLLLARAPPPPDGTPTTPVLATLSPLLGAPAFLRLHVKLKHESTALC